MLLRFLNFVGTLKLRWNSLEPPTTHFGFTLEPKKVPTGCKKVPTEKRQLIIN